MVSSDGRRLFIWLAIGVAAGFFLYEIRAILLPFVVGVMTAYFLDPLADRLERGGLARGAATALITVLFFTLLIGAAVLIVPLIVHQCVEMAEATPEYLAELQRQYSARMDAWLARIDPNQAEAVRGALGNAAGDLLKWGAELISGVFRSGVAAVNILSLLLITPLVTFYLLRDWDGLVAYAQRLLPRAHAEVIGEQFRRIDATLAGFLRGQVNVCFVLALYYGILLTLAQLPFGLVIGLATGVMVILPYVGVLFMFLVAAGVGLANFGVTAPFFVVLGIYGAGQVLEGYFLTPRLVGGRVGLHPVWIIFGMLAGGTLFGLVGVLLSVPVTAIAGVLTRFATERYLQSDLYHGR